MQIYTSKLTSVNTSVLPAIYKRIKWDKIKQAFPKDSYVVFDYGCGREREHLRKYMTSKEWIWFGYDPNWNEGQSEFEEFDDTLKLSYSNPNILPVIITSNVLNVINDEAEINRILEYCAQNPNLLYFHKIYLGDKTGVPRVTKKDCFQWNKPASFYARSKFDIVKGGEYITHSLYAKFL